MMTNHAPSHEYALIERLRKILGNQESYPYSVGIGDDAAVRTNSDGSKLIVTADVSVENVHFSRSYMSMEEIGYRAMVSNVSDCAAMGALPDSAFVQIVAPQGDPGSIQGIEAIYRGFKEACERWGFTIAGGDLSRGSQWVIAITFIGKLDVHERPLLRTGIKPGDHVFASGVPGRSAAGLALLRKYGRSAIAANYEHLALAHVKPEARVGLGRSFVGDHSVHAVMDLSDGLSKDCATLCHDNRCGMILEADSSLIPEGMVQLSIEMDVSWKEWFFNGGEDYELLFTASAEFDPARYPECQIIRIGTCTSEAGCLMVREHDMIQPLVPGSFDHFAPT